MRHYDPVNDSYGAEPAMGYFSTEMTAPGQRFKARRFAYHFVEKPSSEASTIRLFPAVTRYLQRRLASR